MKRKILTIVAVGILLAGWALSKYHFGGGSFQNERLNNFIKSSKSTTKK